MKKNKYDIFLTLKKLKKNKLLNNLSTLNDEKKRLDFVKETLNEMLNQSAVEESGELSGSDLKFRASLKLISFTLCLVFKNLFRFLPMNPLFPIIKIFFIII